MTQAHINSILPIKNRVLAADEHTTFLAHYDLSENDVLRGIQSIGESKVAVFDTTYFKPAGTQYSISDKLTMTAWVYPTTAPTGDRGAIVIGKPSGGYYMTLNTTYNLSVYWHGKTPAGYHDSTGICPLNEWSHIAVVWSSTELKLYINGVLDKTIPATGGGIIPTAIDIGSENGTNRHFKGKISSLGIWAQEKSAEDIKNIMNKGALGNESGLRAFWKMNEGEGAILRDASAFHQDIAPELNKTFSWSTGNSVFTLRPQEGYFGGGAIAVEEGTVNLLYDNGIFNGTFNTLTLTPTVTSVVPESKWIIKTNAGAEGTIRFYVPLSKLTNGLTYNLSYKYKIIRGNTFNMGDWCDTSLTKKDIDFGDYKFSSAYGTRATYDSTFHFMDFNISPDTEIEMWDIQLEQKSLNTSFVNGVRPTGLLMYPNPVYGEGEGTVNFWCKYPDTRSVLTSQVWFWDYDGTTVTEWFGISNTGGTYKLMNFGNADASLYQNEWHMYTIVKDSSNTLRTYIDGELVESRTGSGSITNMFKSSPKISIGSHSNGAYTANILMDELRIDKVARTDEEIMAWYQSNSPFWPRGIYRKSY